MHRELRRTISKLMTAFEKERKASLSKQITGIKSKHADLDSTRELLERITKIQLLKLLQSILTISSTQFQRKLCVRRWTNAYFTSQLQSRNNYFQKHMLRSVQNRAKSYRICLQSRGKMLFSRTIHLYQISDRQLYTCEHSENKYLTLTGFFQL